MFRTGLTPLQALTDPLADCSPLQDPALCCYQSQRRPPWHLCSTGSSANSSSHPSPNPARTASPSHNSLASSHGTATTGCLASGIGQPPIPGIWARTILPGIEEGFHIALQPNPQCRSSAGNAPSAQAQSQAVDAYIASQVAQEYLAGPFTPDECSRIATSSLAVIPKKTPGKWRMIVDLSWP